MKVPMILLCFVLLTIVDVYGFGAKCPVPKVSQDISYRELRGDWIMAAVHPNINQKCKSDTFSVTGDNVYELHEEYYHKELYLFWWHSKEDYTVEKEPKTTTITLKKKSFPYDKSEYTLLGGDYSNYVIVYRCTNYLYLYTTEKYELWTRSGVNFKASNLPDSVKDTLRANGLAASDLTFRTDADCSH